MCQLAYQAAPSEKYTYVPVPNTGKRILHIKEARYAATVRVLCLRNLKQMEQLGRPVGTICLVFVAKVYFQTDIGNQTSMKHWPVAPRMESLKNFEVGNKLCNPHGLLSDFTSTHL